jgi:NAD(P)-dependent dehydrogenase (short-subunit alcohol dehydrogenase family)
MGRLEGRKAVITGAARGIGRAIALRFAAEGADLVLTDLIARDVDPVCKEVKAIGGKAVALGWDITRYNEAAERLAEARDALGDFNLLVNNAGVVRLPEDHPNPTPEAAWDYVMNANIKGLYFVAEAAGEMMKQTGGVIINLASDAGIRGAPSAYGISKWGVIGYTRGQARKLAPHGVRINAIAPGPAATRMMGCPDGIPKESDELPLGRYCLVEEIADVALFLASDDSRALYGHIIGVNTAEY